MSATMPPLKVAHVARRFTFDEWGGTETVVWNTVLRQRALGVDAQILATAALSVPGEELRDGIRIRRFAYRYPYWPMDRKTRLVLDKKGGNPFSPGLFRALEEGGFDLIHIHSGGRIAVMCVLLAHRLGIPCVMSLHGGCAAVPPEELRKMMAPTRGRFHYGGIIDRLRGYRRDAVAECDAVICISREEEALLAHRFPGRRIVYLPNGVDCEAFREKPPISPRREWGIPESRRILLCISRIDYQKNQEILLDVTAREPETHLVLIGPVTSEWYAGKLRERAERLGVTERVTLIPGLPPGDPRLKAILHEAELFVLPSLHEPFGIVALEAWAAGVPVVAARTGGLKDFIEDGRTGLLVDPHDVDELAARCGELLRDPARRERLAAAAREEVRKYSWEAITERLLELYRELRGEGR